MQAVMLDAPGPLGEGRLRYAAREDPRPGTGQIVVEVLACGVCRSNLHMIEGDWVSYGVPAFVPIVPGHEVIGRVVDRGPGVEWPALGARVGVQPLWSSCLHCDYCLTGREQLCPQKHITGETVDGGYAELMLATAAHAHLVPEAVGDVEGAPLFCPGITAYNAVEKAALHPGMSVVLFGVGGVGHMVIQIAALTGATVYAMARSDEHLALAEELGAVPVRAGGGPIAPGQVGGGVDAAIVFAPSDAMLHQALALLRPGGTAVLGVHAQVGEIPFADEKRVVGSVIGSRHQMGQVLELAASGKIRAQCETFGLSEASAALSRLKAGDIRARAVLVPER
ncbi:MAG TPA: alcohol dehydrogenase catalytic domain-containing protein [Acidimicrobiales bacterium]|nr:alcohol dehydrogenase catalytic domain-containing protein [Acidimicrobiales bacterium]